MCFSAYPRVRNMDRLFGQFRSPRRPLTEQCRKCCLTSCQRQGYDRKVREVLQVGDFVLIIIQNVGLKGKHKLASKWECDRYVGYTSVSVEKVLHQNVLLPLQLPQKLPVVRSEIEVWEKWIPRDQKSSSEEGSECSDSGDDVVIDIQVRGEQFEVQVCR